MRNVQGSVFKSLRSVQAFLTANATALGDVPASGASKKLDDIVVALDGYAGAQSGNNLAAQGATQKQYALRQILLRDHMAPIARIAAAELPDTPELEPLRMPRGRTTPERLKALAHGMADAATPWASTFTAAGLPTDFIAQLTAAADAVVDSVGERHQSSAKRAAATAGLKTLLSKGRKVVHILDAMVRRAGADNPSLLAAWNFAKRVQLQPGGTSTAVAPTPAPSPSPAPPAAPTAPDPAPTPAAP